jgi:hypothetical protein
MISNRRFSPWAILATLLMWWPASECVAQPANACGTTLTADDHRYIYQYVLNELIRSPLSYDKLPLKCLEISLTKSIHISKQGVKWHDKALERALHFLQLDTIVTATAHYIPFQPKWTPKKVNVSLKTKLTRYDAKLLFNNERDNILMHVAFSDIACLNDKYYLQVEYTKKETPWDDIISSSVLIYEFSISGIGILSFDYKYAYYPYINKIEFKKSLDDKCNFWEQIELKCK